VKKAQDCLPERFFDFGYADLRTICAVEKGFISENCAGFVGIVVFGYLPE